MSETAPIRLIDGKNFHACAIEVEGRGILIRGPSGSGKTSLAHGLIDHFSHAGKSAVWISDDQVILEARHADLWAIAPDAIEGKAELFGHGIVEVPFKSETRICLDVSLIADEKIERMPDEQFSAYVSDASECEISVPLVKVPQKHEAQAMRLVAAKLAQLAKQGHG